MSQKLKSYGFVMKVCFNCGYFKFNEAIAANCEGKQGYCLFNNIDKGSKTKDYSFIWDSCKNIIPAQAREFILQQVGLNN